MKGTRSDKYYYIVFILFGFYLTFQLAKSCSRVKYPVTKSWEVREPDNEDPSLTNRKFKVLATKYNPVPEQCDSDYLTTADNSSIDLVKLNRYELKWVAVSRDLLKHFNYGDTILVESDNVNLSGEWVIKDTMNRRFTNRIDFLCPINDNYEFDRPINLTITKK